jgi:hypothetical protein
MAIKDQTMTTDTDAAGNQYVSEMTATVTETLSDGTEVVAEITTTANPDDPTQVEGHMMVTETAPDGTQTVKEYVTNENGTFIVEEGSLLEQIIEEFLGIDLGDDLTPVMPGVEFAGETDSTTEVFYAEPDFQTEDGDFTVGDEMFDSAVFPANAAENAAADAPFDSEFENTGVANTATPSTDAEFYVASEADTSDYTAETSETDSIDAEAAAQEAHAQAAKDAQSEADEFVAQGDYAAAAQAREAAENEAWEAGDQSMLSAYNAGDLEFAAHRQEQAEEYNQQQAEHARAGDYEAAKEASSNAAFYTRDADSTAGGADHSGQAKAEEYQMDWAIHHEKIADSNADNAAYYAESGDFEKAEYYAAEAVESQGMADYHGDLGEHGGEMAVYDPSSDVSSGGAYEAPDVADYSATDYSADYSTE